MNGLFEKCPNIISLDFSNFNTENITDMSFMFNQCCKLKEIKGINKFITNKVTSMKAMFQDCNEIEYLDLSNFNTEKVTDMEGMFWDCNKLKYLNLLNFSKNCEAKNMLRFKSKNNCKFITNNKDLIKLYNSS